MAQVVLVPRAGPLRQCAGAGPSSKAAIVSLIRVPRACRVAAQPARSSRTRLTLCQAAAASTPAGDEWSRERGEEAGSSSIWRRIVSNPHDSSIFRLAIPALATFLLDPLASIVDTVILGHVGSAELAGSGLGSVAFSFISSVLVFLAVGTTQQVAKAWRKGDDSEANDRVARVSDPRRTVSAWHRSPSPGLGDAGPVETA